METEQEVINEPSAGLYSTWGTEKESTNNTNDKTNTEELMMADTILPATTIHSYDSPMEVKTLKYSRRLLKLSPVKSLYTSLT